MSLRRAREADASSLAALSIEVWIGTYLKHGVNAFFADFMLAEFTAQKFAALIDDPNQWIMVSENRDGIDGFIRISTPSHAPIEGQSNVEIATFYVQPRHHGSGVGSALLEAALTHCRVCLAESVWLTTNAENAPAIAFYKRRGFVQVGETHFRIGDEAYLNNIYALDLK